jgi:hypothetical protein
MSQLLVITEDSCRGSIPARLVLESIYRGNVRGPDLAIPSDSPFSKRGGIVIPSFYKRRVREDLFGFQVLIYVLQHPIDIL